jgi:dsRNA-specific ribonuclease
LVKVDLPTFGRPITAIKLGKDHNAKFTVNCFLKDHSIQVQQEAKSIKRAEQMCAEVLLEKLSLVAINDSVCPLTT